MDVEVESNPILSTVIFWKMSEIPFFVFFKERESGRDGERKEEKHRCERETSMVASCMRLDQEPNLQSRFAP